jgi:Uma2 family endonuclease
MSEHEDPTLLDPIFLRAEQLGIRLEIVRGLPMWEAAPALRHQRAVDRIRASIKLRPGSPSGCQCLHVADVYVRFPDGLKRPDVSIFCREPDEQEDAITLVPEAVIEVISPNYEAKDLEIGPSFYLSQGVKDVVVFDPKTSVVLHCTATQTRRGLSPMPIDLQCGCQLVA